MTIRKQEIQEWLVDYIANLMNLPAEEILPDQEFTSFGLDSVSVVGLSSDLGDWLKIEIDPTTVYDYPTIEAVCTFVAGKLETSASFERAVVNN